MTRLAEVVAAAVALLDSQGDLCDPDTCDDATLTAIAGGAELMQQLYDWNDHGVLPTRADALQRLGELWMGADGALALARQDG